MAEGVSFFRNSVFNNFGQVWPLGYYFTGDTITVFELSMRTSSEIPENIVGRKVWTQYTLEVKHGDKYLTGSYVSYDDPDRNVPVVESIKDDVIKWLAVEGVLHLYSDNYYDVDLIKLAFPSMISDGELTVKMVDAKFFDWFPEDGLVLSDSFFSQFDYLKVLLNTTEDASTVEYRIINNPNNSETLNLTMEIGDVPNNADPKKAILVAVGDSSARLLNKTSDWNGTGASLQEVIINEAAAMRSGVLRIFDGEFWDKSPSTNNLALWNRIQYRGVAYQYLTAKFNTMTDILTGRWYELNSADLSAVAPVIPEFNVMPILPEIRPIKNDILTAPEKSRDNETIYNTEESNSIEYFDDVAGNSIVTTANLPDITAYTVDEIRQLVKVNTRTSYRYNPTLDKQHHFKIDNATNSIIFRSALRGADVDVEIKTF